MEKQLYIIKKSKWCDCCSHIQVQDNSNHNGKFGFLIMGLELFLLRISVSQLNVFSQPYW